MLRPSPDRLPPAMPVLVSPLVTVRRDARSRTVAELGLLALRHQHHILDRSRFRPRLLKWPDLCGVGVALSSLERGGVGRSTLADSRLSHRGTGQGFPFAGAGS